VIEYVQEILSRQWTDLLARPSGPLCFRFLLQPAMAMAFAIRDGMRDARRGRRPYFWTILTDPTRRVARLREGFKAMLRVIILGLVMDAIYQFVEFRTFYPVEALIVTFVLAWLPYFLLRGPIERIVYWWLNRHVPKPGGTSA
jgi:hypothetical protein